jgi:hypothetical protein
VKVHALTISVEVGLESEWVVKVGVDLGEVDEHVLDAPGEVVINDLVSML